MKKSARAFVSTVVTAAAFGFGCGDADDAFQGDELVAIEKVPASAMDAARKAIPGISFDKAYKGKFDGEEAFEIVGKTKNGKTREVEVSATGKVLNIE